MSWALDRRAERIGTAVAVVGLSVIPTAWVGGAFIQKALERPATYSEAAPSIPNSTPDKQSPFTISTLDCTRANFKGSVTFPKGGQLRSGPSEESDPAGKIFTSTSVNIERVVQVEHVEGPPQYWVMIDPATIPGYVSPAVSEAYIRLGILSSDNDAGMYTNGDIGECKTDIQNP